MPRQKKLADPRDWPIVENEPSLEDWLAGHKAKLLWQHDGAIDRKGIPAYRVAGYQVGTRTALVVIRPYSLGWDIFTAGNSTEIEDTLEDAESRLGIGQ